MALLDCNISDQFWIKNKLQTFAKQTKHFKTQREILFQLFGADMKLLNKLFVAVTLSAFSFRIALCDLIPLENCEILDLSHPYSADTTIYWPGAGAFQLTTVFRGILLYF